MHRQHRCNGAAVAAGSDRTKSIMYKDVQRRKTKWERDIRRRLDEWREREREREVEVVLTKETRRSLQEKREELDAWTFEGSNKEETPPGE